MSSSSASEPTPYPEPQHILPSSFDTCFDEPGVQNQRENFEMFKHFTIRDECVVDFGFICDPGFSKWIPRAPQAAPAPPAPHQQVSSVLEGEVSLASLSELITQMEGRIIRRLDLVDECLDILQYSVKLLQDNGEDDVDADDDAPET
ncbi:hypothetical protein V6N12_031220 [Hibiscus sabdariffa]|uniref:Uncharacterized protein n=1 Tax=Hibiscus sabdariffa TaxID=183260 RepID=A0ABR2E8R9_9ROSI